MIFQEFRTITYQMYPQVIKANHTLKEKRAVCILKRPNIDINSLALPGKPLTLQAFKNWVASAEAAPSVTLKAAQSQWTKQRKQLLKLAAK
jgi:hypothetical protein